MSYLTEKTLTFLCDFKKSVVGLRSFTLGNEHESITFHVAILGNEPAITLTVDDLITLLENIQLVRN